VSDLAELLLDWYAQHARTMPWRDQPDPYAIWVSEVMLQQTRVETVIQYFKKWMERFPDIPTLARSSEDEILAVWEGLGYYSRARNLYRTAQVIMEKYSGIIPDQVSELIKLPGIGRYTAGAIASIAYKANEPVLDGNIRRVFSRLFDIQENVSSPHVEKLLWNMVADELPIGKAGDYNQALMDLGAIICVPQNPKCGDCPLIKLCLAKERGVQQDRPVAVKKAISPLYTYVGAVIQAEENYFIMKRPALGLLGGMWDFPNGRIIHLGSDLEENLLNLMAEQFGFKIMIDCQLGVFRHAYTHFRLIYYAYFCHYNEKLIQSPERCWVTAEDLSKFPMGKISRQISLTLQGNGNNRLREKSSAHAE
jgi:A/G-specific adenine glycosylase